jgi:uncharacterized protein
VIRVPGYEGCWYPDAVRDFVVGIISDTHGLLRPEAVSALDGCDLILHAGDVGSEAVLQGLRAVAPVHAVRGNVDRGHWSADLPVTASVKVRGLFFYVLHSIGDLDLDPAAAGFAAVVTGHSHQPKITSKAGVVYINPGSAGPRRFRLPVCVARAVLCDDGIRAEIVTLLP